MNRTTVATLAAVGRVGIGLFALVDPERMARPWIGADADRPGGRTLARALGVRDLVFGIGTLIAVRAEQDPAPWLAAGVFADGVDCVATVAEPGIPLQGKLFVGALAGGVTAAQLGALLLGEREA